MDFDKLVELLEENTKDIEKKCLICHQSNDDKLLKLKCNHYYHLDCLKPKKLKTKCLYCEFITKSRVCKIKNCINRTYFESQKCEEHINTKIIDKKKKQKNNICKVILKSGKNKGKECGRNNCGYHNKVINL